MTDKRRRIDPLPVRSPDGRPSDVELGNAIPRLPTEAILGGLPKVSSPPPQPVVEHPEPPKPRRNRPAYVPPKLGQQLPRQLRITNPVSNLISQWLNSMVRALRGMHMYADNNARRREYFDQVVGLLDEILRKVPKIQLEVLDDRILCAGDCVHYSPDRMQGLSSMLLMNGVKKLHVLRGAEPIETVRLLSVLSIDFSKPENATEDLVSILTGLDLPHVRAFGPAAPKQAAPATPPPRAEPVIEKPIYEPREPSVDTDRSEPERLPTGAFMAIAEEEPALDPFTDDEATVVPPADSIQKKIPAFPTEPTASMPIAEIVARIESKTHEPPLPPKRPIDNAQTIAARIIRDTQTEVSGWALAAVERSNAKNTRDPAENTDPDREHDQTADETTDETNEQTADELDDQTYEDPFEEDGPSDTLPQMTSPFAGLDDIAMPEIAEDLVLPPEPDPEPRKPARRKPRR